MHMGMVSLIMERCIPPQAGAVDFHMFAEHCPLGSQQSHPLFGTVITESCRVLPPQGYNVCPDRAFVVDYLILYLRQHHRLTRVREQTMLADTLHAWTVCNVVHIVFPLGYKVEVLLQRTGDQFRGISYGGV